MLHCKIYDSKNEQVLLDFEITHFSERLIETNITMSIVAPVHEWATGKLDYYEPLTANYIGKIEFYKDEELIGSYDGYDSISGVSLEYGNAKQAVIQSTRGANGKEVVNGGEFSII